MMNRVTLSITLIGRVAPDYDVQAMSAPVAQLVTVLDDRFDYPGQDEGPAPDDQGRRRLAQLILTEGPPKKRRAS